jgi:hypothetical protein
MLFRGVESDKDRLACLRKARRTRVATQEASLATLREIRGDCAHVVLRQSSIMRACEIGARLPPIFGCPHRSILREV